MEQHNKGHVCHMQLVEFNCKRYMYTAVCFMFLCASFHICGSLS